MLGLSYDCHMYISVIWLSYVRYISGIYHIWDHDCHMTVICIHLSYDCHMLGIYLVYIISGTMPYTRHIPDIIWHILSYDIQCHITGICLVYIGYTSYAVICQVYIPVIYLHFNISTGSRCMISVLCYDMQYHIWYHGIKTMIFQNLWYQYVLIS